jgi:glycosyltransferase involved in cell wall biosynthesis
MNSSNSTRVAWLLPSAFFYWQPALSEFTRIFPQTVVFTGRYHGFAPGYENLLTIKEVGTRKILEFGQSAIGYKPSFTYLSPSVIGQLFQFKPNVIFSSSFGIWTILALLFKFLGKWRVVIAYEGCSPGVDFRNSPLRLIMRRIMVRAADAYLSNSQAGRDYLINYLQADPDRTFVQPYEIPAIKALFGAVKETDVDLNVLQKPVFLFVGGIIPRKGLHLLLQSCVRLKEWGYANYTLLIVGDGSQRSELQDLCDQHGLQDCVKWAGRVDYGSLGQYFQSADILFFLP